MSYSEPVNYVSQLQVKAVNLKRKIDVLKERENTKYEGKILKQKSVL